jgi:hypothetical protein
MSDEQLKAQLLQIIADGLATARRFRGFSDIPVLVRSLSADPVWSLFGLEDEDFVIDKVIGNYVTSVFRKFGDIYESLVKTVLSARLDIPPDGLAHTVDVIINNKPQPRSIDAMVHLSAIRSRQKRAAVKAAGLQLIQRLLEPKPTLDDFTALGFEIRCCYQIGDSKRIQADETMGNALLSNKVLPVLMIFCTNSLISPVRRLRRSWFVTEGQDSYDFLRDLTGFDLYSFLRDNSDFLKEEGRKVIEMMLKYKRRT